MLQPRVVLMAIAALFAADSAQATEAVAGRYVAAAFAGPGAGIIPPVPGMYWDVSNVFYTGNTAGEVPFGDTTIAVGLDATTFGTALIGIYVPKWDLPGNWTYATLGALPFGWSEATAAIGPFEVTQTEVGLGDIGFAPLLLGWHNDALNTFVSFGLTVTAPTGVWEEGRIAFIGLNYWTFSPSIGFTRLIPEHGLDLSAYLGVDINTRNPDTDYYSGAMAHLDLSVTKSVTENLSFGAIAGFLYQVEDDDSAFADARNGFKGRAIAVGPLVQYKATFDEDSEVYFKLSWAHEIEVENRLKGDGVFLEVSGKF